MLETITPSKIKNLKIEDQTLLAEEIRQKIIQTVNQNGGHLASNLGVVELTIGLFNVFDFTKDRVIWDVGHQCYPYKLLTGRYDRFDTLRQKDGISGFPKRQESEFDFYNTGHAGNSVSAAIGMAKAFSVLKEDRTVIAVIGDGSFSNGLIYEALNSLTELNVNVLIILNNNEMSISPTVGKTHEILSEKETTKREKNIELIEQYGVKFMDEPNGNDIQAMTLALQKAKDQLKTSSVLLQIHTVKGRGYDFCEENPTKTHGVSPVSAKPIPEYSQIVGETLCEMAKTDKNIAVVTAAMTDALGLRNFFNEYPERAMDVGICEENASVLCAGLACAGMKPYFSIYSTFLQRAFDELLIDICAQDLPVTFLIDRGGLSGADGETHQGIYDLSYLSLIPNMTIAVPKDGQELRQIILKSRTFAHPLAIRFPRSTKNSNKEPLDFEFGSFETLKQGNGNLAVLACGERAIEIAKTVQENTGFDFTLINARFVKPLDEELLNSLQEKNIITIEDNAKIGGFGDQVIRFYANKGKNVTTFAYDDLFIPHGTVSELQNEFGLNTKKIADAVKKAYEIR